MKLVSRCLIFTFVLMLLTSCHYNEGKFNITNHSDFDIDSLRIHPDALQQTMSLKKEENILVYTKMTAVNSDGSYLISFKNLEDNSIVSKSFGYYTNGYQIEDQINIIILNDTILIESKI